MDIFSFPVSWSKGTSSAFFGVLITEEIYGVGGKGSGRAAMIEVRTIWSPF